MSAVDQAAPISTDDLRKLLAGATPGPWQEGEAAPRVVFAWRFAPDDPRAVVCECCDEATAELIAIAPQLAAEVLACRADLAAPSAQPVARCVVPVGQTPLDEKLNHRFLDVIKEGETARDAGTGSPYHGHSLEHCLHAVGWVSRDLRLALDETRSRAAPSAPEGQPITMTYRNYRGEVADRTVTPKRIWWGSTDWHPEPGWLMTAYDPDKQADRDFALADADFRRIAPSAPAEVEGLVKRLYKAANKTPTKDDAVMREAATALAALQATIARLTAERDQARAEAAAAYEVAAQVARDCYPDPQAESDPGYIPKAIRALTTEPGTTALAEMLDAETRACAQVALDWWKGYDRTTPHQLILARIDQRKGAGK